MLVQQALRTGAALWKRPGLNSLMNSAGARHAAGQALSGRRPLGPGKRNPSNIPSSAEFSVDIRQGRTRMTARGHWRGLGLPSDLRGYNEVTKGCAAAGLNLGQDLPA
jgi:hypothetical protein